MEIKTYSWAYVLVLSSCPWSPVAAILLKSEPPLKSPTMETHITPITAAVPSSKGPTNQQFHCCLRHHLRVSPTARIACSHVVLCREKVPFCILHSAESCETLNLSWKWRNHHHVHTTTCCYSLYTVAEQPQHRSATPIKFRPCKILLYLCMEEHWGERCILSGSPPIIILPVKIVCVVEYTEER